MLDQFLAGGKSEQLCRLPGPAQGHSERLHWARAGHAPVLEGSGQAAPQQGLPSQLRDFQGALHDDISQLMQRGGLGRLCAGIALKGSGLRGCQSLQ